MSCKAIRRWPGGLCVYLPRRYLLGPKPQSGSRAQGSWQLAAPSSYYSGSLLIGRFLGGVRRCDFFFEREALGLRKCGFHQNSKVLRSEAEVNFDEPT
jgi:hypothetical protein